MFEIVWQEITTRGVFKTKRKSFKTLAARDAFIDRLQEKDSFWMILAYGE